MTPESYDIVVQSKEPGGVAQIIYPGAFTMMAPELSSVDPNFGVTGDTIVIPGNYFSTKKGKVYLENIRTGKKKKCKVTSWSMDSITFEVPKISKSFPPGYYPLKIHNKIGIATADFTLEP